MVSAPWMHSFRAGLSWSRSPFRNQCTAFTPMPGVGGAEGHPDFFYRELQGREAGFITDTCASRRTSAHEERGRDGRGGTGGGGAQAGRGGGERAAGR